MSIANLGAFQFPSNNINNSLANIVMNNVDEGIMITDQHSRIIYVNKKFEVITGLKFSEIKNTTPKTLQSHIQELAFFEKMKEVVMKTGKWQGELWNRTKNREFFLQSLSVLAIHNDEGQIENFIGIFSDLLHNKSIENEYLQQVSYYDPLTALPNRFLFEKRVVSAIMRTEQRMNP